jgi:hypothetical protein
VEHLHKGQILVLLVLLLVVLVLLLQSMEHLLVVAAVAVDHHKVELVHVQHPMVVELVLNSPQQLELLELLTQVAVAAVDQELAALAVQVL